MASGQAIPLARVREADMRRLLFLVGRILLSVPWFMGWPVHIWNWAARAHYIPIKERQQFFSWCVAGFGGVVMYTLAILMGGGIMLVLNALCLYVGMGLATVHSGILLSREYRHLRDQKLISQKPEKSI
ncbi:MAG: hypothetical protein Q8P19_02320 [bacterium]|nr:hypothetical protein [bacterium]